MYAAVGDFRTVAWADIDSDGYADCYMGGNGDHRLLHACLKSLPCSVMISGYWSEMYARELGG